MRRLALLILLILALSVSVAAAQDDTPDGASDEWIDAFLVAEVFPSPDSSEIATDAVITVIFNRPVVPLLSAEEMAGLPQPLSFFPEVAGSGEWINTSIYMFHPDDSWPVGATVIVMVDPDFKVADLVKVCTSLVVTLPPITEPAFKFTPVPSTSSSTMVDPANKVISSVKVMVELRVISTPICEPAVKLLEMIKLLSFSAIMSLASVISPLIVVSTLNTEPAVTREPPSA